MKTGEKIDCAKFTSGFRPFDDMTGFVNAVRRNTIVWSWGASAWTKMNDYCLRFAVNGHHHQGHVYLVVNGLDLFDIYLTSNKGTIKEIITDIYIEDLVEVVDNHVERIAAYKQ
jgi:hypothetical protein